ncbi:MAG: relaxase/mobilization nuclease domain-containing protein [Treponema sp.]|nr:relaxase/mobilization nuclease domain-containing protein [Treponema sp.]
MKVDFEKYRQQRDRQQEERLRIQWKFARYDDDAAQLKKLYGKLAPRGAHFSKSGGGGFSGAGSYRGWDPNSDKQFVMVKMRYSDKLDSHQKFLEEYITQEKKEGVAVKPVVFTGKLNPFASGGERKVVYGQEALEEYKSKMVGRHYKFIISPDSKDVPLEQFTTAYMHRIQREMGMRLDWLAAIHTDTGHPHVHILVNGRTAEGLEPSRLFRKDFIRHRCRTIASDIATNMIGPRTDEQKKIAREKIFEALRWTPNDQHIQEASQDGLVVPANEFMRRRLDFLTTKGLAQFKDGKYILDKKWDEILVNTGRYNSFLEAREELKWTDKANLELFSGKGKIQGKVTKLYCMNEEYQHNNGLLVEDGKGQAWFVPLFNPPPAQFAGKNVIIENQANSKGLLVPKIQLDKEAMLREKMEKRNEKGKEW